MATTLQDLARPEAERLAREWHTVSNLRAFAWEAIYHRQQEEWIAAHASLLADLSRPESLAYWRRFLAEREGLDSRHGVTFRREHKWEGGAWYSLVAEARDPDDHTTRGDPTRWYASESIERLMSAEADRILPALAHGPDEAEALAIIVAAVVAEREGQ